MTGQPKARQVVSSATAHGLKMARLADARSPTEHTPRVLTDEACLVT